MLRHQLGGAANKVAHNRSDHFGEANLEKGLDAVAGLFCLAIAYHRPQLWDSPWPNF